MYPRIEHIDDVRPHLADKKEIRFAVQPNGATIGCYMFMDGKTFDTALALECRGLAFDAAGNIISRPLHKFFNLGERPYTLPTVIAMRDDLVAMYEKLDGSMLATAWVDGKLCWRSKNSFESDVVKLAEQLLKDPKYANVLQFATEVAQSGYTAIFEMLHPLARIVVPVTEPSLTLLHVRENVTGRYVTLDQEHAVSRLAEKLQVPRNPSLPLLPLGELMASLENLQGKEGYVLQFADGDMVKLKCPWYLRLHGSIVFMRERDIARLALEEELDDLKATLTEAGVDFQEVEAVEARLKSTLIDIADEVEKTTIPDRELSRKDFAAKHLRNPLFPLMMNVYQGRDMGLKDWYSKNRLRTDFSIRVLVDGALADVLEA